MQFWLAFAFGAGVLWLFASDQFNHPSWTDDERLTRILSVPHLRGDRVRRRALLVYLLLLFVVYTIFVFFAGVIVLAVEKGVSSGAPAGGGPVPDLSLPGASVPFAVSLALVGIAPRVELLTKVEQKIRVAAHELMGLPRGLFSSGQKLADSELSLDEIGRENILPDDLERFTRHVEAAKAVFGQQAVRVKLFERRLLKLIAYRVWIVDGLWPSTETREPYEVLEADFATDLNACFADLDDIAGTSVEGLSNPDRESLRKRWNDRMGATQALCGELCTLMFIYSEREDPGAGRNIDSLHRSIADFTVGATGGKSTVPELDIAVKSILWAVAIAGTWGCIGTMLRPLSGLKAENPGVAALIAALGALCLYGPAIMAAVALNGRVRGSRVTVTQGIVSFLASLLLSLFFLVVLNVTQAVIRGQVEVSAILRVVYAALLTEAPMALLGAIQGAFVLRYFNLYRDTKQPEAVRRWRLVAVNIAAMLLASTVATYLVVAAIETVGLWSNPAYVRSVVPADFVSRVPAAGLIALVFGLVINSALWSDDRGVVLNQPTVAV